ncbi:uncharacterized protein BDR25DRAFT_319755 [Lindgomyces ingoldianus]|uniref:Uncharacterized protein n=1 Tax=Lindgomyces ingoldianus TaxID=673940 RepID=A0ACB6QC51_9PLEO|nr:uncharacterized protein BDR25DRAFT_319755 [Lindgomyces ingoldianus]KAF2463731.1 hypothetical protein BDR25DRAFT_319755 [Lindgomyces ingoldianus]
MRVELLLAVWVWTFLGQSMPLKKRDPDLDPTHCPSFCAGTNSSSDPNLYVCGDPRLGPVVLPTSLPLEGIAGADSTYHRFGGLCPGNFLATYTDNKTGQFVYPPFNGFSLSTSGQPIIANMTLTTGTFLDRFGSEFGTFMSPGGAPYAQRALPPTNLNAAPGAAFPYNYRVYLVERSLTVQAGPITGWFGQQGLGLQFIMPGTILSLVDQGYLSRVNLTADPYWK